MIEILQLLHDSLAFKEVVFWCGFLFFNFSLFAFNYIIHSKEAEFFPFKTILVKGKGGIFISANPDIFRFSIDVSLLIFLVRYGIIMSKLWIIVVYYGFLLVFNAYHYAFNKIYKVKPIIINDLKLIKNGIGKA